MKIDSHHHLWTLSRGDYGWMTPDLTPIYRDFTPTDLAPHLAAAGIDKTVVVQAADTVAETEFLLATAAQTDWIAGVVGWVDMEAPEATATLERLAQSPWFKGIRPMIQDLEDDEWILRPSLDRAFDALVEMGLSFDALVLPRHLKPLIRRLEGTPDLTCVIDHLAKPALATGYLEAWGRDIAEIARNTPCRCKLSGMVTEAGPDYDVENLRPAAVHVIDSFGPSRVMWGSDWPVVNLAGDYAGWVTLTEDLVNHLSADDRAHIWEKTARGFYNLD